MALKDALPEPPQHDSPVSPETLRTNQSVRIISGLTVTLVTLLALASFTLSFEALWHFAAESGALARERAWLFPVVVDGSIIVFSISTLRCSIVGDDTRWSMSLVVISTAASVIFNMAHAPGGFMPALVGATPPVLLFLSFESLLRQISGSLGGKHSSLSELLPLQKGKAVPKPIRLQATPKKPEGSPDDTRREKARQLLALGTPKRQIAREVGLGIATIRRLAANATTPSLV